MKMIDPKKDSMDLGDDSIKCFHVQMKPPQIVIPITLNILKVFMKFDEKELISALRELQAYAELIIYTFLPETLV